MSFLDQLRHQQADAEHGLQLCYLLRIDRQRRSATLALILAEPRVAGRQARLDEAGKAYVPQRSHLQTPPPFLDAGDVRRLQTLVEADVDWLQGSEGALPQQESWPFLRDLLDSQRCFIEHGPDRWVALTAGVEQRVNPHWVIDAAGRQQLNWQLPTGGLLFYLSPSFTEPFVYRSAEASVAPCQHTLSAEALTTALPHFYAALPPEKVDSLLHDRTLWHSLELPLPSELHCESVPASMTPVLHCASTSKAKSGGIQDVLQLRFRYCSDDFCICIEPGAHGAELSYWNGFQLRAMRRQSVREQHCQQQLADCLASFKRCEAPASWQARDENAWRYLLTEARPLLEALGFYISIAAGFRHHYVVANHWQADINKAPDHQWRLSVQLSMDGEPVDLLGLLRQLQHVDYAGGPSTLRLADGRLLLLPDDKLNGLMAELGDLLQYASPDDGGAYCLPDSQLNRLHTLHQQLPADTEWRGDVSALERAAELHRSPVTLNQENCGIRAQLRPYQWQGVCWLQHLQRQHANGLLADDMGLGKTLQTLAHLCLEHQQGRLQSPALIVAPTSLLHNWAAEIDRFAPHLRRQIIHGPQRHQHWSQLQAFDILISSYPLIVNDLPRWQQHTLSWVVLDEAQWIKNPRTQASQAVRQLNSEHRLCLSGTPVENHLGELWSIVDFLMPRCLGSAKNFKRYFQKPIEREANSDRLQQLLQRVAPFMLRRTKDQVATDLPAKTEIHQTISLADDQQAFYQGLKTAGWSELQARLADASPGGQQQILLLTALLKLRQACCDPQLLGETGVSSSKREHCVEMIEELVSEQRAILVFSQFTTMLELLAQDLEHRGINYLMLTGQTRRRQTMVDAFQGGEAPVFLISLKAGGVGLNLTRADTVIHYDPWWNSSAEQQASDRAHRIGQDKPVFVYKLIAENTIEEKIAELQQRKALLSQHINHQAQASGDQFALKLDELLALWQDDTEHDEKGFPNGPPKRF